MKAVRSRTGLLIGVACSSDSNYRHGKKNLNRVGLLALVMRDDVLLFIHSWDKMSYSVHEHDFESPWLLDVNRGNSHISRDVGFILITFGEFILSVSSEGQN